MTTQSESLARITRVNELARRYQAGEKLTQQEIADTIKELRAARATATSAAKTPKSKPTAPIDLNALFPGGNDL